MQHGLLYQSVHTYRFAVPAMLDAGATRLFVSHKLAEKLPATIKITTLLTVALHIGKKMFVILAIQLDMLIDDFIYI